MRQGTQPPMKQGAQPPMRLLVMNPNSSQAITNRIQREVKAFETSQLRIDVITSKDGPAAIITDADELAAGYCGVRELQQREAGYDAMIIACASDPGLSAARETLGIPVVGIFEAAIHICNMAGNRFCIVASGDEGEIPCFAQMVGRYGYESRFTSVETLGAGVLGVSESDIDTIEEKINRAKRQSGVNAAILGCAAFAGMGRQLSKRCGIYVSDGIGESILLAKALAELNWIRQNSR